MNFHTRLKQLRQKSRMTQSELAKVLGLRPTAVSNYESMRNEPSYEKLVALAKYFDVSCDYLLGVTDSFLPTGGEVLDREVVEFYLKYQRLNEENVQELKKFMDYMLHKQEADEK